jgi:hypothetical protein
VSPSFSISFEMKSKAKFLVIGCFESGQPANGMAHLPPRFARRLTQPNVIFRGFAPLYQTAGGHVQPELGSFSYLISILPGWPRKAIGRDLHIL